ncbi:MAG: biopolymer transporter ExbB [Rhodobacteraceae bacterium]|nr:biopolymer transporter ExbB [Paracoccaceae bacterium]
MDVSDPRTELHFSQPVRQIVLMLLVLGLVASGGTLAAPRVLPVFEANPYLNGFILFVFFIGVVGCFWQVAQLITSVRWIERFVGKHDDVMDAKAPRLLAPLATLLRTRGMAMQIGSSSNRSILDSVATRIDEAREFTRYLVNLLIFLGLLGTFYGLATTVPALVDTIRSLAPQDGEEGAAVFGRLMNGLDSQLSGMGVAFGSSLLGLAGSLVVGLLELFAGHGQNRFYRELEEWLSSITRVGFSSGDGDSGSEQSMVAGILDHMAQQMEKMQNIFASAESSRFVVDEKLGRLADALDNMTRRMEASDNVDNGMQRVAEGQYRLVETLQQLDLGDGFDAESRMRLRSMDVQMLRILEEIAAGRQETMAELRADLASLHEPLENMAQLMAGRQSIRQMREKARLASASDGSVQEG